MRTLLQPVFRLPVFATLFVLISLASLLPLPELPAVVGSDKMHHIVAFTIWSMMLWIYPHKYNIALWLFIIWWGGAIELIQPYVNRYGEWFDFGADMFGALLGLLLALVSINLCRHWQSSKDSKS